MEASRNSIAELAARLKGLGPIMVLDLGQATTLRSIHSFWVHDGVFYLRPPNGTKAAEVEKILDEYRERGEIHLDYNAQSTLDVPHRPILPLDSFADKYFSDTKDGVIKITAVARNKLAELHTLLDEFKHPFDPAEFPFIDQITLTGFRPAAKDRQMMASFMPVVNDWKQLRGIEEGVRRFLAEINFSREIIVNRHSVQGLHPEIALTSADATTPLGEKFLSDFAHYLGEHSLSPEEVEKLLEAGNQAPLSVSEPELAQFNFAPRPKQEAPELTSAQKYRLVLETMRDTLKSMKVFEGLDQSVSGQTLLVHFSKKGLLGIGGHFGKEHVVPLESAYRAARRTPQIETGWSAFYHYDPSSRLLTVRVVLGEEKVPGNWKQLGEAEY